jgi:hypothetical protein
MDSDLAMLDALLFLTVISSSVSTPPSSPAQGDRYIVATGGAGVWAGQDNKVAVYVDTAWGFLAPNVGWLAHVQDTGADSRFTGAAWVVGGSPYTLQVWRFKLPWNPAEPIFSVQMERTVSFPLGFSQSRATCKSAPAAVAQVLPVYQDASVVGNVTFGIGATTGTFNLASALTYASGDVFEVYPSATPDPAFGGLRLTFAGNR